MRPSDAVMCAAKVITRVKGREHGRYFRFDCRGDALKDYA